MIRGLDFLMVIRLLLLVFGFIVSKKTMMHDILLKLMVNIYMRLVVLLTNYASFLLRDFLLRILEAIIWILLSNCLLNLLLLKLGFFFISGSELPILISYHNSIILLLLQIRLCRSIQFLFIDIFVIINEGPNVKSLIF